jgi:hypothetical protein
LKFGIWLKHKLFKDQVLSKIKYITEEELAQMLCISKSTLANQRSLHKGIPYVKFGRAVRYDLNDVISFMESQKN